MTINPNKATKTDALRPRKQRGPPEDGVPSKTKVMVANLPYDLREEKVSWWRFALHGTDANMVY